MRIRGGVRVPQKLRHLFRLQIKVVQKHGAQFETNASKPLLQLLLQVPVPLRLLLLQLQLLLPLNAPNELLLAEDAVLGRHPFFNHVLYDAVVHKRVHDAQGVLRLRVDQKVVQVAVQIQIQIQKVHRKSTKINQNQPKSTKIN
jgi:hypothetical protein